MNIEIYGNNKSTDFNRSLIVLNMNYPHLFDNFKDQFLFITHIENNKNSFLSSIKILGHFNQLLNVNVSELKTEIALKKYKTVKKIFCNILWVENNPFFIEELIWRFIISSPSTLPSLFEKEPEGHMQLMIDQGFANNATEYQKMCKRLNRHLKRHAKGITSNFKFRLYFLKIHRIDMSQKYYSYISEDQ